MADATDSNPPAAEPAPAAAAESAEDEAKVTLISLVRVRMRVPALAGR